MKKEKYLLLLPVLSLFFAACTDMEELDEAWKIANEDAYLKTAADANFKELITTSGPSGVYYKVIKSGISTGEFPFQTSNVKVRYEGFFYDGTIFDVGSTLKDEPIELSLSETIRGFSFALQNMVVGDKWEIWIPYNLGYGAANYTNSGSGQVIKAYSTLVFEIELVEIIRYPK
ncbi:MAG: FKBP-type peptidyl-prolyl cis-trans isomerase [Dysgonamonadaceae bacterium]|jgi:FKBP-type peptidyl-prolyl cis-trans isomerase|nr:FKBP-type peptidyl-prolyl cis-trans isomerase [Dysgonamonadaceae bacterium]